MTTYPIGGTVSGLSGTVVLQDNGGDDLSVSASGAFTFGTGLTSGTAYSVTVKTNPAGQTCSVANGSGTVGSAGVTNVAVTCTANAAATYPIGGTVSGLSGTVVLQDNGGDDLSVSASGAFTFGTGLTSGTAYSVTVKTNPAGQTCSVANGSGTVGSAGVTNVAVTCTANAAATYPIGGTVSGLSGTVVLQDNGGDDLSVSASGAFTFGTGLTSGTAYSVTVKTNPAGQTCSVANGSGTVGSAGVTNVAVTCTANAAGSASDNFDRADGALGSNWTTVSGTGAPQIVSNTLRVRTAGALSSAYWSASTFSSDQFAQASLPNSSGTQYGPGIAVRLSGSKGYFLWYGNSSNTVSLWRMDSSSSETLLKQSASLTVSPSSDVWKIQAVGSTISGYQNGKLVVQATDTNITSGSPGVWLYYSSNQIDNWSGGDVTTYPIGGTVSGLSGTVVLQDNGGDDLSVSASGAFTFGTGLTSGTAYSVTVKTNPAGQTCSVANGSGTVGSAGVTNVAVTCTANAAATYPIGGTVSGLSGTVVLQDNGGDDLSVSASGAFTFGTGLTSGTAYSVTVKTNPAGQTCSVANGSGTVGSAGVTNVAVTCTANAAGSASDNFDRADGALGSNWTTVSGTGAPQIVSNTLRVRTAGALSSAYWSASTFSSDQFAQASLPNSSGTQYGPGIAVRLSGSKGYFLWYGNSSNTVSLWRMDSSSSETLLKQSASLTVSPSSDVWKIQAVGSTISGYQNGKLVVQATDANITSGSPGVWLYYSSNQIDNWSGGDVTTATTYPIGGTVSGLSGTVVLQDNGGDDLSVSASGAFTFGTGLTSGTAYSVTVKTNPAGQTCSVANGSGTVGSAGVTNVAVTCTANAAGSASDNFDRADGALGSNWTNISDGGLTISSQAVAGTSTSGTTGDIRTAESYSSNQYSQVEVTSSQLTGDQWIGPAVRMQNGGQDGYLGIYDWNNGNPELMLYMRSGGNWTELGAYSSDPLAAGTQLKLMVVGSTLSFLENGVEKISVYEKSLVGGAPGIMANGTGKVDNWSGGSAGFEAHYLSTDANGVQSYDMISADNGYGPQILRVLRPTNPAAGVAHNFLFMLPVEAGLGTTYGDGLATIEAANLQNQYNLTIIEPSFAIDPWYADNPNDPNLQYETFMTSELEPWVKANLATTGTEQNWLIGFSKSGIGAEDLLLKHPDLFTLAATWDFPAGMSDYDGTDPIRGTTVGGDPQDGYGTSANFQANYRLSAAFLDAHKAPFVGSNRIWIGGYSAFQTDMTYYDSLLATEGIAHSTETPTSMAHRWDSGWVPLALAALEQDSLNVH